MAILQEPQVASVDSDSHYIEFAKLPRAIRVAKFGVLWSIIGLAIGNGISRVASLFIPGFRGNGIAWWLWPILIIIWAPGILGLILTLYAVGRYPYVSMATGGGPRTITKPSWIWGFLGVLFYLVAPLVALSAFATESTYLEIAAMLYLSTVLLFVGFLLTSYRCERHVTIASFLELTMGIGIFLFPIYVPSLIIGSWRCRRFLARLESEFGSDDG